MDRDTLIWAVGCSKCGRPVPIRNWNQPLVCSTCQKKLSAPRNCEYLFVYCPQCKKWRSVPRNLIYDFHCSCRIKPPLPASAASSTRQLLLLRYDLLEKLGQGMSGEVWKAIDVKSNHVIALKFIKEGAESQILRANREVKALTRLNHSGIIPIYRYLQQPGFPVVHDGIVTNFDRSYDTACIVMKYVYQGDLARWMMNKFITPQIVARIFVKICEALDVIHQAGIVHRDLKLTNILMDDSHPIITDFGLSHLKDATPITREGLIIGSLDYLAPEQAQGQKADIRSDLYALGAMMWKMLFNKPVYEGSHPLVQLRRIFRDPIPQDIETLPPSFQLLLRRLLVKDPRLRTQNAKDVRRALLVFLEKGAEEKVVETASTNGLTSTQERPRQSGRVSTRRLAYKKRKRKTALRKTIILIAIMSLLLILWGIFRMWHLT